MKKYYVEWFIEKDPIEFFETLEEAKTFASKLFSIQVDRNRYQSYLFNISRRSSDKEFSVIGEILPNGKKKIIIWQGFKRKLDEYEKQIEKEFEEFQNNIPNAIKYYGKIASSN